MPETLFLPTALFETLQRYAGWLNRDRPSVVVRADVAALGVAISTGLDTRAPLDAVDEGLKRLPGGSMKTMLRATAAKVRRELEVAAALPDAAPED
jgi:hypothetical protein